MKSPAREAGDRRSPLLFPLDQVSHCYASKKVGPVIPAFPDCIGISPKLIACGFCHFEKLNRGVLPETLDRLETSPPLQFSVSLIRLNHPPKRREDRIKRATH